MVDLQLTMLSYILKYTLCVQYEKTSFVSKQLNTPNLSKCQYNSTFARLCLCVIMAL